MPTDLHVCTASITFNTAQATDNCAVNTTLLSTPATPSGSNFVLGTTTVGFWANDTTGNAGSCTFNVTVLDQEAPRLSEWKR